ncbi:MAG: hypothetical protein EAZ91_18850 [Cytophagales bacterium]|nr:MAG: hypothetical protein EAZ91_18850 [Cytophagales bacterium]
MLFPYQYVSHTVEKLQIYLQHTVFHVWCKADGPFSIKLLHPDFRPIVEEISQNKNDYLLTPIRAIYETCLQMDKEQRLLLAHAFRKNNNIKGLCEGLVKPVLYSQLKPISDDLVKHLKELSKDLYNHVLGLKPFYSRCGVIDDHYDQFMLQNTVGKCPFCGINDVMSEKLPARDAYDHYLPKDSYPFNTINLRNLVPACKTCNSSFKLAYDPIKNGTRKAFYPFSNPNYTIDISVIIDYLDYASPKQNRIRLSYRCDTMDGQLTTWREIYKLDDVYIDKCSSDDSKYWIEQVYDEVQNHVELFGQRLTPREYLTVSLPKLRKRPMKQYNFLRVPFLEGCVAAGIF